MEVYLFFRRNHSKISVLFYQKHLFLNFSRSLHVFTENILIFQEVICDYRTDTSFPGRSSCSPKRCYFFWGRLFCSSNRYSFSKSSFLVSEQTPNFSGAIFLCSPNRYQFSRSTLLVAEQIPILGYFFIFLYF